MAVCSIGQVDHDLPDKLQVSYGLCATRRTLQRACSVSLPITDVTAQTRARVQGHAKDNSRG